MNPATRVFQPMRTVLSILTLFVMLAACAPRLMATGYDVYLAKFEQKNVAMADAARLPLRIWNAAQPRAVIVALHGMNDYSNAFADPGPGPWLAARGVTVYAYDQRGFGGAPGRGLWAGTPRMVKDLDTVIALARQAHPGLPVYVLGESMGGAVALAAMGRPEAPKVDGIILAAPAVWGWKTMNPVYEMVLWASAHTAPGMELTGRGLNIQPSDNISMLRALGKDPMVIKGTQIGTIYGLVNLMDDAFVAAPGVKAPVLLLYGENDRLVPSGPVGRTVAAMEAAGADLTVACYPDGWHMLLRDLKRETVWNDLLSWIDDRHAPLPSGNMDRGPCKFDQQAAQPEAAAAVDALSKFLALPPPSGQ